MRRFNLHKAEFRYDDEDPAGYRSAVADVGGVLGAKEHATYVYELPPGQALCAYHYEYVEEWLIVLEGSPTVRLPESEEPRVAPMIPYPPDDRARSTRIAKQMQADPTGPSALFMTNMGGFNPNSRDARAAEIGSATGV